MDWIDSLNKALDMIENHLTDEIDYDELSAITHVRFIIFKRFSCICPDFHSMNIYV